MNSTRLFLANMSMGGLIVAALLAGSPSAHADEASYIDLVAAQGTNVNSATLPLGHQICDSAASKGVDGITAEAVAAYYAGVSSHDAAVLLTSAISELCPSQTPTLRAWEVQIANLPGHTEQS
jgi:hypothetical protein